LTQQRPFILFSLFSLALLTRKTSILLFFLILLHITLIYNIPTTDHGSLPLILFDAPSSSDPSFRSMPLRL
jgi:hypothetical protein